MITEIQSNLLTFIGPLGERVTVHSALELAKQYDLVPDAVRAVARGRRRSHKGWRLEQPVRFCSDLYTLYRSDGTISTFDSAVVWAEEQGYSYSEVRKLLCGVRKTLDGWSKEKPVGIRTLINDKTGEVAHISNVRKFCSERELAPSPVYEVLAGKRLSYKGWKTKRSFRKTTWKVLSPSGEEFFIRKGNVRDFCREHNLDNSNFGKMLSGQFTQHRGWSVVERNLIHDTPETSQDGF